MSKGFPELFGWFLLALADFAAIDHYVMLVRGSVDADRTEGKLLEAHTQALASIIRSGMILDISAVTFAVRDMARSVVFYRKLGFELVYGGESAAFSSLKAGAAFVNLAANPGYEYRWWGRAVFRVDDVDAHHRTLQAQGLMPELPRDAPWGERFFHVIDPDGHELSFAELLPARC